MNFDNLEECVDIENPPLFCVDEMTFKFVVASQSNPKDLSNEIYEVLCKALLEYTAKRNMSLGYSALTKFVRKEV